MRYFVIFILVCLTACSYRYQSIYPDLRREIVTSSATTGWETVGHVEDNSTFLFGRLKVLDKYKDEDITRYCQFRGLSNKYMRISALGPEAAHVRDDSLFFRTSPASNIHTDTGLFAVHTDEGKVGLIPEEGNHRNDHHGGEIYCRKKGKYAKLNFNSAISDSYTKTYIGDFTLTFLRGDAFTYTIEDNMDATYEDLVKLIPSADNEKVKLEKSVAVKY